MNEKKNQEVSKVGNAQQSAHAKMPDGQKGQGWEVKNVQNVDETMSHSKVIKKKSLHRPQFLLLRYHLLVP